MKKDVKIFEEFINESTTDWKNYTVDEIINNRDDTDDDIDYYTALAQK